jgi:hypothetical protein
LLLVHVLTQNPLPGAGPSASKSGAAFWERLLATGSVGIMQLGLCAGRLSSRIGSQDVKQKFKGNGKINKKMFLLIS